MKNSLKLFCLVFILCLGLKSYGQYSISGYLDAPEKNKRVYLSLIKYNEQSTISSEQVLTSTRTDSLGYFNFEGKLLSEKQGLYRIHTNITENSTGLDLADIEEKKNFHNFVFSNQDTIVFEKNAQYWFSSNTNTNQVDKEWREFGYYARKLREEFSGLRNVEVKNQSSFQFLWELKAYAQNKETHPLVTLILLSDVSEDVLKRDLKEDVQFYENLQSSLNTYYDNGLYAEQFKELIINLSIDETQLELAFYKRWMPVVAVVCGFFFLVIVVLLIKLRGTKQKTSLQTSINFTNQEERIAQLILQEKTNKEIAAELFISLSTVKTHVRNIYAKLEVSNRHEFVDKMKNHPRD